MLGGCEGSRCEVLDQENSAQLSSALSGEVPIAGEGHEGSLFYCQHHFTVIHIDTTGTQNIHRVQKMAASKEVLIAAIGNHEAISRIAKY